ncbi:hypothetical protein D3C73_1200460 [compost metagenome]
MQVDGDFAGDGADVDQVPTTMERFKGLGQAFVGSPWAQGINDHIDAFAMGDFKDPFIGGNRTKGMNFDPARSCQVFHLLEQLLVSRSAEDFSYPHGQR